MCSHVSVTTHHFRSRKVPDEDMSLSTAVPDRQKKWLEDLVACITAPLQLLTSDDIKKGEVAKYVAIAFDFAFSKAVLLSGTTFSTWKLLRKEIRQLIIKAHGNELMNVGNASIDTSAGIDSVTTSVLNMLQEPEMDIYVSAPDEIDTSMQTGAGANVGIIKTMSEDQGFVRGLTTFVSRNLRQAYMGALPGSVPVAAQPACTDLHHRMIGKVSTLNLNRVRGGDAVKVPMILQAFAEDTSIL